MPPTIPVPPMCGCDPVFEEIEKDGVTTLVKVGENPLNEFVQASLQDTLVYNILERYNKGDLSALDRKHGQFVDVTGMPTSLAEAQQALIDVDLNFSKLPLEVRNAFNNDPVDFVKGASDGRLVQFLKSLESVPDSEFYKKDGEKNEP